jgi:hypothetical protein
VIWSGEVAPPNSHYNLHQGAHTRSSKFKFKINLPNGHYYLQRAAIPNWMDSTALWRHINAFFSTAEKPSENITRLLFLMNMKGLNMGALSVKWTSFYVVYSGGCKCNSLWPASLRSSRTADRAYSFTKYVILCRTLPKFTLPPHGNLRIYYVFLINLILHEPRSIC